MSVVSRPHRDGGVEYLLVRRPDKGLLAGQWEFPSVVHAPLSPASSASALRQQLLDALLASLMPRASLSPSSTLSRFPVGDLLHVFSHRRHLMHVEVRMLAAAGTDADADDCAEGDQRKERWVKADELEAVGLTTGQCKVLQLALAGQPSVGGSVPRQKSATKTAPPRERMSSAPKAKNGDEVREVGNGRRGRDAEEEEDEVEEEWEVWPEPPPVASTSHGSKEEMIVIDDDD